MRHIAVLGPMGVGKSTTAAGVAQVLGLRYRDSDTDIEAIDGRVGREIAKADGIARLHELEAQVLLDALQTEARIVVSAAASVVDRPDCRAALEQSATVVVLHLPIEALVERIATGPHRRTINPDELEALQRRRAPLFEQIADAELDANLSTERLVQAVLDIASSPCTRSSHS